jgi:carboxylesterase type B
MKTAVSLSAALARIFWALEISASPSPLSSHEVSSNITGPKPTVDLGYATYQGITNATTNISSFRGIRYAAPPVGPLRYQAPQPPLISNSTSPIDATSFAGFPICAQTGYNPLPANAGSEDCLFLSVAAPVNATNLPVLVWIHGGGYENGNGKVEFTEMMQQSNNSFVTVAVQYRLNSFGFLSSADVKHGGVLNAGLLDQEAALKWVHEYIHLFGGDNSRVTIGGESAGAGSVYYHASFSSVCCLMAVD